LKQTSIVVYLAIDAFFPITGKAEPGLAGFLETLGEHNIPVVLMTARCRLQMDEPIRRLHHAHPFIAESGSGVYLPEDYFHLRVEGMVRFGRFVCLPIAQPQPAAQEALEALSEATGVPVVTLRSLSPRELTQNTGLPPRDAEMVRQRDFEEMFFLAGADEEAIHRFRAEAQQRNLVLHEVPPLWSLSVGADPRPAIKKLSALYDRALHGHAATVGVGASAALEDCLQGCDRVLLLTRRSIAAQSSATTSGRVRSIPLPAGGDWSEIVPLLTQRG
jgi:predicted mannosyl-3-phosphoglycerate phosphatase (HAD superfamily)